MDPENTRIMNELVQEHVQARERVKSLVAAKGRYVSGDAGAWKEVAEVLSWLTSFYPIHIKKEDAVFFPKTEGYFSAAELDGLLSRFNDFDAGMIHEKYRKLVEEYAAPRRA